SEEKPLSTKNPIKQTRGLQQRFLCSHVDSPAHFFIHYKNNWESIDTLSSKLNEFFQAQSKNDLLPTVEEGTFCCAQFTEDDSWTSGALPQWRDLESSVPMLKSLQMTVVRTEGHHLYVELKDAEGNDIKATLRKEGHVGRERRQLINFIFIKVAQLQQRRSLTSSSSSDSFAISYNCNIVNIIIKPS
ncbi:hypothetical protein OS493_040417, partial [Desmophyllum pertusum]